MTEQEVVLRAEQALLGGLLAGGDQGRVQGIRAGDFSDPRHQAIYLALTGAGAEAGGAREWLRGRGDRAARRTVREAVAYLDELVTVCPGPEHVASYAAMVTQAGAGRAAGGAAEEAGPAAEGRDGDHPGSADAQLASADSWLSVNGARARRGGRASAGAGVPGAGGGDPLQDRAVVELARGLRAAVVARVEAGRGALVTREASGSAATGDRAEGVRQGISRESLQRLVLADLMRRPGDGREVAERIPAAMFTAGPARRLYGLIRERIVSGKAVDPVIIAWEAGERYGAGPVAGGPLEWSLGEIALRIGATPTAAGTARVYGRALLAEHMLSSRFGDWWTREADFAGRLYLSAADGEPEERRAVARGEGRTPGQQHDGIAPSGQAREPVADAVALSVPSPEVARPGIPAGLDRTVAGAPEPGNGTAPRR